MLLALIEIGLDVSFRATYWVVEKTVVSAWRWYWPVETVETLSERVRLLNAQVGALQQRLEAASPSPPPPPPQPQPADPQSQE